MPILCLFNCLLTLADIVLFHVILLFQTYLHKLQVLNCSHTLLNLAPCQPKEQGTMLADSSRMFQDIPSALSAKMAQSHAFKLMLVPLAWFRK